MKKLLAIASVLSLAISGAALANSTVKSEQVSPIAHSHQGKMKAEKKVNKEKPTQVGKSAK